MLKAIVAMDARQGIGYKNTLPWSLPEDLAWFKKMTLGSRIVMGRKTWESIGSKPLPGRENIVLSRDGEYSMLRILAESSDVDTWIIGGEEIYRAFAPYIDMLYVTIVRGTYQCDVRFPVEMDDYLVVKEGKARRSVTGVDYRHVVYGATWTHRMSDYLFEEIGEI